MKDNAVQVRQEDRDAADEFADTILCHPDFVAQAFARHRQTHRPEPSEGEVERLVEDEAAALAIIDKAWREAGMSQGPFFGEAYEPGTVIRSIVQQVAALSRCDLLAGELEQLCNEHGEIQLSLAGEGLAWKPGGDFDPFVPWTELRQAPAPADGEPLGDGGDYGVTGSTPAPSASPTPRGAGE